jgi:histidine ammonia-lyase
VFRLCRQPGEIDVAASLRALTVQGGAASPSAGAPSVSEHARRHAEMGACLDLLRQAGTTLERAANSPSEEKLVFWQTGETVSAAPDVSALALAADLVAFGLCRIGLLAGRRVAARFDASSDREQEPAAGTPPSMAASFVAENRERARPSALDEREEDAADLAVPGARRLLPMVGTTALIVAIELLVAAKAAAGRETNDAEPLEAARRLLRERLPQTGEDGRISAPDLAAAADLVRSGALASAPGISLPEVVPAPVEKPGVRLGARRKRK